MQRQGALCAIWSKLKEVAMKKISILALMLVIIFSITACGVGSTQDLTTQGAPTAEPTAEPSLAIDPRLDGYETVPITRVNFLARKTYPSWIKGPILILTSAQELTQLIEGKDGLSSTSRDELIATYNDEYFSHGALMVVQFTLSSGSDQVHDFLGVVIEDGKLCPVIEHGLKGFGTADIKYSVMLVALDKEYAAKELGEILTIDKYHDENSSFKPKNDQ